MSEAEMIAEAEAFRVAEESSYTDAYPADEDGEPDAPSRTHTLEPDDIPF